MTLTEKQIKRIRELKGTTNMTVKEIANSVEVAESSVKKYASDDYEKDNKLDEKAGYWLTKIMEEEGYDFQDEIKPLVYSLKVQTNEIGIPLHDYLTNIRNNTNKFLRITCKPEWFYYVLMELANDYSLINDHIDATKIMETVDNFYNREIEMEESEKLLAENEAKAELLLNNTKERYRYWEERTATLQEESKAKAEGLLYDAKIKLNDLNKRIDEAQKNYELLKLLQTTMLNKNIGNDKKIETENQELKIKLKQSDKDNNITKQENKLMEIVLKEVSINFPVELELIINKVKNEIK